LFAVPHPPLSPSFPYTTLFRSLRQLLFHGVGSEGRQHRTATGQNAERTTDGRATHDGGPGFLELLLVRVQCTDLGVHRDALVAQDRKSTRLNSSHVKISYAVFC